MSIRGIFTLLAGDDREPTAEEDIAQARRELDEALAALRTARAGWSSAHTMDPDALRAALDLAERQLDAARQRLQRALDRRR
ncbi:MAG TPA: hypothetical protein VFH78_01090 [Candidatus Thermoplasmatota archaeon]|nr:hypothetical protein [Candidatus Thermoplasmatota archaeon]